MKSDSGTKWERTREKGLLRYVVVFSLIQCATVVLIGAALTLVRRFVLGTDREYNFFQGFNLYLFLAIAGISPLWAVINWHLAERQHQKKAKFYDTGGSTLGLGK